jgi:hypothetical protein
MSKQQNIEYKPAYMTDEEVAAETGITLNSVRLLVDVVIRRKAPRGARYLDLYRRVADTQRWRHRERHSAPKEKGENNGD